MADNQAPFQIITGPFAVYTAAVGTAFPDVDEAPSSSWTLLGAGGTKDISDGVTVTLSQTIERDAFRFQGTTGARKAVRTQEDVMIAFTLHDFTAEMVAKAMNDLTVTDTAAGSGTPGTRKISLHRGQEVAQMALLVKGGTSPYGDSWSMQYQVPVCYQNGSPAPVHAKGAPAGLAFEFVALENPSASAGDEFGHLVVQDATAL